MCHTLLLLLALAPLLQQLLGLLVGLARRRVGRGRRAPVDCAAVVTAVLAARATQPGKRDYDQKNLSQDGNEGSSRGLLDRIEKK